MSLKDSRPIFGRRCKVSMFEESKRASSPVKTPLLILLRAPDDPLIEAGNPMFRASVAGKATALVADPPATSHGPIGP
jgi:hypothetical protein